MGKFDGVLLASDYDATFAVGTEVPADNLEMLDYFKAQGGRFTISTGRARHTFQVVRHLVPLNAPVLLANGAMICDLEREEVLFERPLPPTAREDMIHLSQLHPEMSLEVYAGENHLYAWNPNPYTEAHLEHMRKHCTALLCPIGEMPLPWDKAMFEHDHQILLSLQRDILERWGDRYESFFSDDHMLELNAKGCTKGFAVLRLADMLNIRRENIYCAGDNQNDLSMLEVAAIPFAPANAIPAVREFPGVHLLPPCEEGAIAELIRQLDAIY